MDEKRIFLARHGQTFHNAAAGESHIDADRLSSTGHEQARRLGRLLTERGVTAVVTSPLPRARETAEAAAEALACRLEEDERLIEIVTPPHAEDDPEREAEHWSVYIWPGTHATAITRLEAPSPSPRSWNGCGQSSRASCAAIAR